MKIFTRDDGRELRVIAGFRKRVLSYRKSVSPRSGWNDEDYAWAITKRVKRGRRLIENVTRRYGSLKNSEVLEIGCGDGLNTMLFGLQPVKRAVGIDLDLRLNRRDEKAESIRRVVAGVLETIGAGKSLEQCLNSSRVELLTMEATQMEFPDSSFDLILSRSVLEHIQPVEKALEEMARVIRPQGMIYHEIDPFCWIRGCHKRGLVDIPWAHSRLQLHEYQRFVAESEGERTADRRLARLKTLNRQTLREWKILMENGPCEIVDWAESRSSFAETVLKEYPDVTSTLLPGIEPKDLVVSRIGVWLRKRAE